MRINFNKCVIRNKHWKRAQECKDRPEPHGAHRDPGIIICWYKLWLYTLLSFYHLSNKCKEDMTVYTACIWENENTCCGLKSLTLFSEFSLGMQLLLDEKKSPNHLNEMSGAYLSRTKSPDVLIFSYLIEMHLMSCSLLTASPSNWLWNVEQILSGLEILGTAFWLISHLIMREIYWNCSHWPNHSKSARKEKWKTIC